jgi:hypothetical protein
MAIKGSHGSGTVLKKCDCANQARCEHGWTLRYWVDGKQHEKTFRDSIGLDKKARPGSGKQLALDFQAKLYVGKRSGDVSFTDTKKGDIPFTQYCETWIASRGNKATRAGYMSTLVHLRPGLAGKTLRQVANDREGVQALIDGIPGTFGPKARIVLVSPCNEALKSGRLANHRLRGLRVPAVSKRAEFTFATDDQLEIMAASLGRLGLLVWLGAWAGLRLGETLGLRISDFREDGTVLRLTRQRLADGTIGPLKARKEGDFRDIPVSLVLWDKVRDAPVDADGYLFPLVWRTTIMDQFSKARNAAVLPGDFVPHWLRHMYASDLLAGGIPITDVAKFLGHQNIQITFDTYGHLAPSAMDRARDVFDKKRSR